MHRITEMSQTTTLESLPLVQNVGMSPTNGSSPSTPRGTYFSSVFALLTTCIGAGTLSLPYAFMKGGLIFSAIVFVAIMVMAIVIGFMLLESKHLVESMGSKAAINNYADLGEFSFGVIGKLVMLLVVAVFLLLTLIAYMIYARDQLEGIVNFIINKGCKDDDDCRAMWYSSLGNQAILMCIAFLPLFPLLLLKSFTPLQYTNTLSIISVLFIALMVTIKSLSSIHHHELPAINDEGEVESWPLDTASALTCVSYCSLAFLFHFNLFGIEAELKQNLHKKIQSIVVISVATAFAIYMFVAVFGYIEFRSCTYSDVMKNYPAEDGLAIAARLALFFTLIFSYPVLMNPCRDAINSLCLLFLRNCTRSRWFAVREEEEMPETTNELHMSKAMWLSETWILFAVTFVPASNVTDVRMVWNFVGSIGGCLILYVLPPMAYLKIRYMHYRHMHGFSRGWWLSAKNLSAFLMTLVGLALLAVENYVAVKDVYNQS